MVRRGPQLAGQARRAGHVVDLPCSSCSAATNWPLQAHARALLEWCVGLKDLIHVNRGKVKMARTRQILACSLPPHHHRNPRPMFIPNLGSVTFSRDGHRGEPIAKIELPCLMPLCLAAPFFVSAAVITTPCMHFAPASTCPAMSACTLGAPLEH